jgi:hypothetical protein
MPLLMLLSLPLLVMHHPSHAVNVTVRLLISLALGTKVLLPQPPRHLPRRKPRWVVPGPLQRAVQLKRKKDSATAQKEEDLVGFVSNKPVHKGQGRPMQTALEFVMHFFKCKSLLPQALINKAQQKLHIGYHPLWIKGDTLNIVMTCVCCGAEGTVHTFGKHACPNFTSSKQRPRDTSHLKPARISVNTLNNVLFQDGDDDELVNLKNVDDDAE